MTPPPPETAAPAPSGVSTTDAAAAVSSPSDLRDEIDSLAAEITKQGSHVRKLKKGSAADASAISEAVTILRDLKIRAEGPRKRRDELDPSERFDRKAFDELVLRKMFVVPSFEIHGGVKGLFDLGPPACALKAAVIDLWRKHFVLTESMLEMECTCLTPESVLKTSGHVDRFTDLMVKDPDGGECFRADKVLEDAIDGLLESDPGMSPDAREGHLRVRRQADAYSPAEIDSLLREYGCNAPSGRPYGDSFPFNLMFRTHIGPEGSAVGFLRPETAQGLFVNFRRLLEYNAGRVPFAAAQVGLGFRNEIAPRAGLLRVREFCMGEIEHFVNPDDKSHPSFPAVSAEELTLFGRDDQLGSGKTTRIAIGEAVRSGLVDNETLGYFMARTQLFMERIGMDPRRMRFRQHLTTEMAHYARDCWDLEIESSYGWVECVGHADRACYDLDVHGRATKTPMLATLKLDRPREVEVAKLKFDRRALGTAFTSDQRVVSGALEALAERWEDFAPVASSLESTGAAEVDGFAVTKDMVSWTRTTKKVHEIKFTPSVIEPSFGMGRILYSLLEHSFYQREGDEQRCVMRFNPRVAPVKVAVAPISSSPEMNAVVDEIASDLMESDVSVRVDKSTASLGRRYARVDEVGVPFAVTVDFETLMDRSVTLRERDTTVQVRLPREDVTRLIFDICHGKMDWERVKERYPVVRVSDEEGGEGDGKAAAAVDGAKTVVEGTIRGRFSRPAEKIL